MKKIGLLVLVDISYSFFNSQNNCIDIQPNINISRISLCDSPLQVNAIKTDFYSSKSAIYNLN